MTSKAAAPPAPLQAKEVPEADLPGKEDVKASATSGTDEPTISSSAGSLQPPNKGDKAAKSPQEAGKPELVPSELNTAPNDDLAAKIGQLTAAETETRPANAADLRKLARKPGSRLQSGMLSTVTNLIESHKGQDFSCQNSAQILGKRLRKKENGQESYRELVDQTESLEDHYGHRVQTPQIFEKTLQLPPRLPGQGALTNSGTAQPGSNVKLHDGNHQGLQTGQLSQSYGPISVGKALEKPQQIPRRTMLPVMTRDEASLMDYDFGLCSNQIELQKNQSKCFENMLDLINLTYFGTQNASGSVVAQPTIQNRLDFQGGAPGARSTRQPASSSNLPHAAQQDDASQSGPLQLRMPPQLAVSQAQGARPAQPAGPGSQQVGSGSALQAPPAAPLNEGQKRMKLSQLDFLANPLRADHPFEIWNPKEMALFTACICQFGKRFDLFVPLIKSKTEQEIYEFYRCWKYTKYYRTWKLKAKDRPKNNMASLNELIYHDRQI